MEFENYIKPELLILVPVLFFAGSIIKNTQAVPDKYIPAILGLAGIALSLLYVITTDGASGVGIFTAITQGILVAGTSVYTHQLIKQITGKEESQEE